MATTHSTSILPAHLPIVRLAEVNRRTAVVWALLTWMGAR